MFFNMAYLATKTSPRDYGLLDRLARLKIFGNNYSLKTTEDSKISTGKTWNTESIRGI